MQALHKSKFPSPFPFGFAVPALLGVQVVQREQQSVPRFREPRLRPSREPGRAAPPAPFPPA